MKPLRIAAAAEVDLRSARHYYNGLSPALGDGFLLHVEDAFDHVADRPEMYQVVFSDVRRIPLHRFPYSVFYRVRSTHVEILAVLHAHRDPARAHQRADSLR